MSGTIDTHYHPDEKGVNALLNRMTVDGSGDSALVDYLYGLSPYQQGTVPKLNADDNTHIFFTRTDMNLSDLNIVRDRKLSSLLNVHDESIQKYTRMALDPYWVDTNNVKSKIFNNYSPFINVLSNTIESLSGWPDEVVESWISPNGMRKEQWGFADGINKVYYSFELDATFTNVVDEPIPAILDAWVTYMTNIRTGNILPYTRNLTGRKLDYATAIWVIVTNKNKRIKKIAKTIGYPIADPKGRYFNFTRNEQKTGLYKTVNSRFRCFGAEYNDPILLLEFNMLMAAFDPRVNSVLYKKGKELVEIPDRFKNMMGFRGVPIIDLKYNTLEFMMDSDLIEKIPLDVNINLPKGPAMI